MSPKHDEVAVDKRREVVEDEVESVRFAGINSFNFLLGLVFSGSGCSTWLWYSAKALFFSFAAIFGIFTFPMKSRQFLRFVLVSQLFKRKIDKKIHRTY